MAAVGSSGHWHRQPLYPVTALYVPLLLKPQERFGGFGGVNAGLLPGGFLATEVLTPRLVFCCVDAYICLYIGMDVNAASKIRVTTPVALDEGGDPDARVATIYASHYRNLVGLAS